MSSPEPASDTAAPDKAGSPKQAAEHVLVPVPEELVDSVYGFLQWARGQTEGGDWDVEKMQRLLASGDDEHRAFLNFLARQRRKSITPTTSTIAGELGLSAREVTALMFEANVLGRGIMGGAGFVVSAIPGEGKIGVAPEMLMGMSELIGELVIEATGSLPAR